MFKMTLGLEIHLQLKTQTKMFCACSTMTLYPNTSLCPVCTAQPGALPQVNEQAVLFATYLALATNSTLHEESTFVRKHYRYADLPKGYQITQLKEPFATKGYLEIDHKKYLIERIQLEEDTGKLLHENDVTYLDLNRCGVPLIELVTEPTFSSKEEALLFLKTLHELVTTLEICEGKMQEGQFRCDVNLSLSSTKELGTRTEIKNLNSFKAIEKAIEYEEKKHRTLLENNQIIHRETLLFDGEKTIALRKKDTDEDYRYFNEPDLLTLKNPFIHTAILPELPQEKLKRLLEEFHLSEKETSLLLDKDVENYFRSILTTYPHPKKSFQWMMNEVQGILKDEKISFKNSFLSGATLGEILSLLENKKLLSSQAKELISFIIQEKKSLSEALKILSFEQIDIREEDLQKICLEVLQDFHQEVEEYKKGKDRLFTLFVGQVLKRLQGKVAPQQVSDCLKKILN